MQEPLFVRAHWDQETRVWVADSEEVPGLASESETVEARVTKPKLLIPGLLELNGVPGEGEITFELFIRRFDTAEGAAA
jgi:Domain of unknown function (DUF1902)